MFPQYIPAELTVLPNAFDHDGFRSLAYVSAEKCRLVSRKGNVYKSFGDLRTSLCPLGSVVLDGEIVNLDGNGRSQFYETMRRRCGEVLYAFDVLWHDGRDVTELKYRERKQVLAEIVKGHPRILYASHIEATGKVLYDLVCRKDLEGFVAKWRFGVYGEGWFRIRNPRYSAYTGRHELFRKRRTAAS